MRLEGDLGGLGGDRGKKNRFEAALDVTKWQDGAKMCQDGT